jgi:hypothetical protein
MKTTFRVINHAGLVSSHSRLNQAMASAVRNGGRIWRETPTAATMWLWGHPRQNTQHDQFAK